MPSIKKRHLLKDFASWEFHYLQESLKRHLSCLCIFSPDYSIEDGRWTAFYSGNTFDWVNLVLSCSYLCLYKLSLEPILS